MKILNFKNYKLYESPDDPSIIYKGNYLSDDDLYYLSKDAITFAYDAITLTFQSIELNKLKRKLKKLKTLQKEEENTKVLNTKILYEIEETKDDIEEYTQYIISKMKTLGLKNLNSFKKLPKIKNKNRNYMMITSKTKSKKTHYDLTGNDREVQLKNGRLWLKHKIISFWDYPETYEELIDVIKDIETSYKIQWGKNLNIIKNIEDWFIDTNTYELTRIVDYKGGAKKYTDEELRAPHNNRDEKKQKEWKQHLIDNDYFKNKKQKPIEWRHALGKWRGESIIYSFSSFKKISE